MSECGFVGKVRSPPVQLLQRRLPQRHRGIRITQLCRAPGEDDIDGGRFASGNIFGRGNLDARADLARAVQSGPDSLVN